MKRMAIKCKKCGDTVFSRTTHDFRYCGCKLVAIDGGGDYTRIIGEQKDYETLQIDLKQTEKELYDDWNTPTDKYGIIKMDKQTEKQPLEEKDVKTANKF